MLDTTWRLIIGFSLMIGSLIVLISLTLTGVFSFARFIFYLLWTCLSFLLMRTRAGFFIIWFIPSWILLSFNLQLRLNFEHDFIFGGTEIRQIFLFCIVLSFTSHCTSFADDTRWLRLLFERVGTQCFVYCYNILFDCRWLYVFSNKTTIGKSETRS